jgi:hypothetical protein
MGIARMHLDRQHFPRIEELEQQREAAKALCQPPHQLILRLFHELADGVPRERPVGNLARVVIAVAQDPRFSDRALRQRGGEQVAQTSSSP